MIFMRSKIHKKYIHLNFYKCTKEVEFFQQKLNKIHYIVRILKYIVKSSLWT